MNDISEKIESTVLTEGADMVGFAPVERFDHGPEKTHPRYYLEDAKAVIVIGISYPKIIGEVWGTYKEEHKLPTPYMQFGFAILNRKLEEIALKVSKYLEIQGYGGIPMPPSYTLSRYRYWESLDTTGKYLGDISFKHAAVAAGLGAFGWSNLFLTKKYGARQRLILIITNAPCSNPKKLLDPQEVCKPDKCGYLCVDVCPIDALSKDKSREFKMDGRIFTYAKLDHNLCRWCLNGLYKGSGSRSHFDPPEKITQAAIRKAQGNRHPADLGLYDMNLIDFCGKCMHQCPSPWF
jgi:epoxyqueuosine reductase QueG